MKNVPHGWLTVNYSTLLDSRTIRTVESVEMGSQKRDLTPGRDGYYPPNHRCLPSPRAMAPPHRMVQAYALSAQPSRPPAGLTITMPGTPAKLSYLLTISSTRLMVLSPYSHHPPTEEGSTMPSANDRTPSERQAHLPDCSSGWMAPLPAIIRTNAPSCSPCQDEQMGGGLFSWKCYPT
jgi:hypothetical protein